MRTTYVVVTTYTSKEETLSSTTVLQMHVIIHKALKQAMKWQLVSRNIEKPKKTKYTPKFLTEEQNYLNKIFHQK